MLLSPHGLAKTVTLDSTPQPNFQAFPATVRWNDLRLTPLTKSIIAKPPREITDDDYASGVFEVLSQYKMIQRTWHALIMLSPAARDELLLSLRNPPKELGRLHHLIHVNQQSSEEIRSKIAVEISRLSTPRKTLSATLQKYGRDLPALYETNCFGDSPLTTFTKLAAQNVEGALTNLEAILYSGSLQPAYLESYAAIALVDRSLLEATSKQFMKSYRKALIEIEEFCSDWLGAIKYHNRGLILSILSKGFNEDTVNILLRAGERGVVTAAQRFRPEKGFLFSTYARLMILREIEVEFAELEPQISLPRRSKDLIAKIDCIQHQITAKTKGRPASTREIAIQYNVEQRKAARLKHRAFDEKSRVSPSEVAEVREMNFVYLEMDMSTTASNGDPINLPDVIADPQAIIPGTLPTDQHIRIREIVTNATSLTEREKRVIQQRFGLLDGVSRTLEEIGKRSKRTRERIRQIQNVALRKLRPLFQEAKILSAAD